ncbi:penicillin-binding protein activator [Roseitranquillus sediminis]|uniref:penicillin-binding protein activator n=1 Tax=Roseitranquillus sediminis TaxID=2809051 RepID=UPI001D0CC996|nr:penicillin-binding protein activator [Roseitranquillus sediminis]MBM9595267.1 penicillin-binding protein activator [Roseitranquillus sediminis]
MLIRSSLFRKAAARLSLLFAALWLAACDVPVAGPVGGPRVDTTRAVPVALLVPAGSAEGGAILARSLENAARLAIADLDGAAIDLRVYDTAGQPGRAAAVAQQAVDEGAQIILGPVFAGAANAAGVAVRDEGVNVLAFSNNSNIAGGNVFVLGTTFQNTASRLTGYAASRGRGDIFVVSGQDTAESVGRDAILRAIAGSRASLAGQATFPLSQAGVRDAAPRIAEQIRSSGADAVFLTSGTSGALPFLADLLPENGIAPGSYQYIGLQRLDIPSSALTLPGLQGAWFALPDPALGRSFDARYAAAYGSQPHPIAGLAYDGIAAIGALIRQGRSDALTARALTQGSGFAGTGGAFRFLADGSVERALAVAEIRNNQVIIVDPAPRRFGGAFF